MNESYVVYIGFCVAVYACIRLVSVFSQTYQVLYIIYINFYVASTANDKIVTTSNNRVVKTACSILETCITAMDACVCSGVHVFHDAKD